MEKDIYSDVIDEKYDQVKNELVGEDKNTSPKSTSKRSELIDQYTVGYNPNKWMGNRHHYPNFLIPIEYNDTFNTSDIIFHINNWQPYLDKNPIIFFINFQEKINNSSENKIIDLVNWLGDYVKKNDINTLIIIRGFWNKSFLAFFTLDANITVSKNIININSDPDVNTLLIKEELNIDKGVLIQTPSEVIELIGSRKLKTKSNIKLV